jgi:hypothetical protein
LKLAILGLSYVPDGWLYLADGCGKTGGSDMGISVEIYHGFINSSGDLVADGDDICLLLALNTALINA